MVVALGPGKFYGSSLPRPRFYTDVKLSDEGRVDPPLPVLDPLLSWANDAHWSMGGLSFKRCRLQGRIEGNIKKLRVEQERRVKIDKKKAANAANITSSPVAGSVPPLSASPLPPPPPPRRLALLNDDGSEEENAVSLSSTLRHLRRKPARKLGDDFDKSAAAATITTFKGSSNDGPVSVESDKASPLKKGNKRSREDDKSLRSSPPSIRVDTVATRTRSRGSGKDEASAGSERPSRRRS